MYCMMHIQNTAFYRKFKHWGIFTSYSGIFSRIVVYLEPCGTFGYSEPCHFLNPGIFRNQDRRCKIYSELCQGIAWQFRILSYWELCNIQNFCLFRTRGIFRILNIDTFRHIQAYSIMIVITTLTFFFFHFNLHPFQRNLKRQLFFNYNYVNFSGRPSLLK